MSEEQETNLVLEGYAKEVNKLHTAFKQKMISFTNEVLTQAIEIGEKLTEMKDKCKHGMFLKIAGDMFIFSPPTARKYMKLYKYKEAFKNKTIESLTDASKIAEEMNKDEINMQNLEIQALVDLRAENGEIPEGWTRACDYAWKKYLLKQTSKANSGTNYNENDEYEDIVVNPLPLEVQEEVDFIIMKYTKLCKRREDEDIRYINQQIEEAFF